MTYHRKTEDEWCLHIDYGHGYGWEEVDYATTYHGIRALARDYQENYPEYPRKITGPHRILKPEFDVV